MKKIKLTLNEELIQMKRVMSMLLNEDGSQNINDYPPCVRTFGAPRETKQYSMFWRIFGTGNWNGYVFSSGGPNPEVMKPDGIRDNYYRDGNGVIQIGKNYGTQYDNRQKQDAALEKAKVQSQNDAAAKAKADAAAKAKADAAKKSVTNKPKYVKPKDLQDIKAFQDWLDTNYSDDQLGKGKGWATGLPGGKLNRASGYGTHGPRTNKAWELYGDRYGLFKKLPAVDLTQQGQQNVTAQNNALWGQQTDINGNPVNVAPPRP